MTVPRYPYSPRQGRPTLEWPDGKRLAFYVGLNVEHFQVGQPGTPLFSLPVPLEIDPLNEGWRDYGPRVGIWRLMEVLDRYELRASVLLNSEVCDEYPQIVEAGKERGWVWCGHGETNSRFWTGLEPADERERIAAIVARLTEATGSQPRGWLAPALTETLNTPALLAEQGFTYLLDWCCDDQPFPLNKDFGRMISVPYGIEINDIVAFLGLGMTGPDFAQAIIDQFDVLRREAQDGIGSVMSLAIHPFIIAQPFRVKYLEQALDHIRSHDDVWLTTSDDIAEWYLDHYYDEALDGD